MTTNKPEIEIYEPSEKGVTAMRKASFRNTGPERYVRLSDYEAMQAECEKLRKEAETERAIQRAAEVLPLGFSIEIEIEKDAGTVALFSPGPSVSCDFHGSVAEQINDAIDAALHKESNP